jgi:ribosomal protein S18 acetylase RimI-like enzyme
MTGIALQIRCAEPTDAEHAIALLLLAMGSIGNRLAGTPDDAETAWILEMFFRREDNRLSFRNALVAERAGEIVGALVAYHGSRCEALDSPFIEWQQERYGHDRVEIEREADPDEYYLDSLAVAEAHRGQGIATALIAAFEAQALASGHYRVALLAEEANSAAFRLYCRLGYRSDGLRQIDGHTFHHMVKPVLFAP